MKILITGCDGYLGGKITKRILETTDLGVVGLTMSMDFVKTMLEREGLTVSDRLSFVTNEEFLNSEDGDMAGEIGGAVHLAFSRRMQPARDIASSIDFAAQIFHKLSEYHIDRVINMSSQGVYGNTEEIRTEDTSPAPETQYTMAKYAAEVLFRDIMRDCPHHTSFRLDPVAQSQNVVKGLVKSAAEGKISLRGGKQVFSFIDADDVPDAVIAMLKTEGEWDSIYNVGWTGRRFTLVELADIISDAAESKGLTRPVIELKEAEISLWAGMDASRFMERTGWRPSVSIEETIESMF